MKNPSVYSIIGVVAVCLAAAESAGAGTLKCPPDSVKVGNVCIDTYEASVWQIPPSNTALVKLVQAGKATLANLTAGGATQLSTSWGSSCLGSTPYPANFPIDGNWTPVPGSSPPSPGVYAVSIPGVLPTACTTWFQANQACALSGKRLVRNGEWQHAAAGTPDAGASPGANDCNTNSANPSNTGSRTNCKSAWGVFDMVGNVDEWVEDWGDLADHCTIWSPAFGSDLSCVGGPGSSYSNLPGAWLRGNAWGGNIYAGVFAVDGRFDPSFSGGATGFRCAR